MALPAIMASPFPIPNNGLEIVWNHTLRYRGYKLQRQFTAIPVNQSGDYYQITVHDDAILRWSDPQKKMLRNWTIFLFIIYSKPRRGSFRWLRGFGAGKPKYVGGGAPRLDVQPARRVRRAPTIAYDNPGTNSDGITTSDSFGDLTEHPTVLTGQCEGVAKNLLPTITIGECWPPMMN